MPKVVTDTILKQALKEYQRAELEPLFDAAGQTPAHPSPEFDRRIRRAIKQRQRKYYRFVNTVGKRVAVIVLAFLLSCSIAITSVKAWREPVFDFIVHTYETFSRIVFHKEPPHDQGNTEPKQTPVGKIFIEEKYSPAFLPSGFSLVDSFDDFGEMSKTYQHGALTFTFTQTPESNVSMTINTEGIETEEVAVGNSQGLYFCNSGMQSIIWTANGYVFHVYGNIEREQLFCIAESVARE